jgi:hypothetical protein
LDTHPSDHYSMDPTHDKARLAYVLLNRAEGRVIDSNVGQDFENQPLP